jgi:hypothetical protein
MVPQTLFRREHGKYLQLEDPDQQETWSPNHISQRTWEVLIYKLGIRISKRLVAPKPYFPEKGDNIYLVPQPYFAENTGSIYNFRIRISKRPGPPQPYFPENTGSTYNLRIRISKRHGPPNLISQRTRGVSTT